MSSIAVLRVKPFSSSLPLIENPHRPALSAMLLLATDVAGLWLILKVVLSSTALAEHPATGMWPMLILFQVLYWICGVYPGISVSPVDDIQRITVANSGAFLVISLGLVLTGAPLRSLLVCLGACICASMGLTILRSVLRRAGRSSVGGDIQ